MVEFYRETLNARQVKDKALKLGADLVGIADGRIMDAHPPDPINPIGPADLSELDSGRVIVLAQHVLSGTSKIQQWDDRHKFYNDEIALSRLEETSLELVYWLEEKGYPAVIIPPTHNDPWRYGGDPNTHRENLLSLSHAAVEAGLGTLGLNLQLLTPEYGPRVILTAVLCSVDVEADTIREHALCLGPECGRCLRSCPGDVIQHWDRDWDACDRFRQPYGFGKFAEHMVGIIEEDDAAKQKNMVRSKETFYLWQSILRGAGAMNGCRNCQDVCPVGKDYENFLQETRESIAEDNEQKSARLENMHQNERAGKLPDRYQEQKRWIGKLTYIE